MTQIWHNLRCRKSRETLAILHEKNEEVEVVLYLETPPTKEELSEVIKKLGIRPEELIRKGETLFKEKFKGRNFSDQEWIDILAANPKLIERPVVIKGGKAAIGRPPENVLEIL